MDPNRKFAKEHTIFNRDREKWLTEGRAGQYVVIKGDEVLGFYVDSGAAFQAGLDRFGAGNFFMSSILPSDATNISFFGIAV